ncbi:hypothetical protein CJ030_MR4G010992 [Morella rubra]|uniref:Myb/SANT-like domain-containing protein n=1 Tax=Morella rubra TaxID=262757 RepID=A0A6A1VST3_9ROSI|nr:hypothetical protein CJ030_MR4G010992 [Morella rubra]
MKGQYRELYDLLHHDMGFGWDPVSNTVEGSAKQWQTYLLHGANIGLSSYLTPLVQGGANIGQSPLSINSRPYLDYIILFDSTADRTPSPSSQCRVGAVTIPLPDDRCSCVGSSNPRSKRVHATRVLNMDVVDEALPIDVPLQMEQHSSLTPASPSLVGEGGTQQ